MVRLVIAAALLSGCAHQDEWSSRDTALQLTVTGLMLADAVTTSRIQDHYAQEKGPVARQILGPQPSTSDTYQYFATIAVTSYLISRALPAKWRPYWQVWEIGVHGYAVKNNCDEGLC